MLRSGVHDRAETDGEDGCDGQRGDQLEVAVCARPRRATATVLGSSRGRAIGLVAFEQREGNGIPLGDATCIIGMQVVSAVVSGKQLCGVAGVP
jgi:hypothetical protein